MSLWLALIFGAVLLAAFVAFPGFFPPMSPQMSAPQVAAFYNRHQTMIRASMIVFNLCGVMLMPFFMVIVYQMKRMATPTQVLAYGYLSAAVSGVTLFAIADLFWLIAAFRPDRDPQQIQLLNDLAWITFIAFPRGHDRRSEPLPGTGGVPRRPGRTDLSPLGGPPQHCGWAGDGARSWCCGVPDRSSRLERRSLFWLRKHTYGVFLVVMFIMLRRAILREESVQTGSAEAELDSAVVP